MNRLVGLFAMLSLMEFPGFGQEPAHQFYFGVLTYPEHRYRLILDIEDSALYVIGLRPNRIPLDKFRRDKNQISFSRADFFSGYEGIFNPASNGIAGYWTDDDKKKIMLEFRVVDPDTISGFKPRVVPRSGYGVPAVEEGIPTRPFSEVGIDPGRIETLLDRLDEGDFEYVHSLLVSRRGALVVEDYFYDFNGSAAFGIQSVTKSLVSALTGMAIARGEVGGGNDPILKWLDKKYKRDISNIAAPITLHHLMSMTTGLEWDEVTYDYGDERNSLSLADARDPFRLLFQKRKLPGNPFAYNSINHSLMNMVLRNATGLTNEMEITSRLLEPLGIKNFDLGNRDNRGLIGDISLRPRDMLKFGMMYLNRGEFAGKQIVPAEWVEISTSTKVPVKENLGYGYFWWTTTYEWKGKEVGCYFAWGYGGQYIFVVPDLELVVVMNGTNWSTDPERYSRQIMQDYLVPACE